MYRHDYRVQLYYLYSNLYTNRLVKLLAVQSKRYNDLASKVLNLVLNANFNSLLMPYFVSYKRALHANTMCLVMCTIHESFDRLWEVCL